MLKYPREFLCQPLLNEVGLNEALGSVYVITSPSISLRINSAAKQPRGSILIVVLWMLFFLALLGGAIMNYVRPRINLTSRLAGRAKSRFIAEAGVKKAMAAIKEDTLAAWEYDALNELWSNDEQAFKDIQLGDGVFSVMNQELGGISGDEVQIKYGLIDEERKLNINMASYGRLARFFEITGKVDSDKAQEIADSIIDWKDADEELRQKGAETDYYQSLEMGYPCKNGYFQSIEELLLVKGVSREIFNSVKDKITIYGAGAVNINTADKLILEGLGMSEALAEKVIHFRCGYDGLPGSKDDNIFESTETIAALLNNNESLSAEEISQLNSLLADNIFCARSDNFRAESIGRINNKPESMRIIFIFDRNNLIKYWRQG